MRWSDLTPGSQPLTGWALMEHMKGNRAGMYAITLTGKYRLIVERISEDKARVLDVEDYHGD